MYGCCKYIIQWRWNRGATGALAPLIVKFRGLSPPKMYRVCLVPRLFFRLDGLVYTRLQKIYALLIAKSGASLQCYCNCCCTVIAGK